MRKRLGFLFLVFVILLIVFLKREETTKIIPLETNKSLVRITSIDTMKYSRDIAREKLEGASFDKVIDRQIKDIAKTYATYVAIDTPYDDEFLPFLKRWVNAARKYKLKVWFRGNFSGWEKWFGYSGIDRKTHIIKTIQFIFNNSDLFVDGDVFGACNECENGGPGDPRYNGDADGHRAFLIEEYKATTNAFEKIGKKVASNYNSMNGDVANLIMDKETTKALGGVVVIDHYVENPEQLSKGIAELSKRSGGKIVLGEFGVPIPDIHGAMSDEKQREWLEKALKMLFDMPELAGVNYWTNVGSSTQLWNSKGDPTPKIEVLKKYYRENLERLH